MTGEGSSPAAAPLRIGVITTSYPRTPDDPAGGFVGGHVRALRALGHQVDVIAAGGDADDPRVTRVPGALFYRGGAPDLIERSPLRAAPAAAAFTLRLAATAAARARAWDAVIAHWLVPSALVALPLGRPLVAIAHGGDVHTLRRLGLLAPALHALHLRGARVVFVSEHLRALARDAAPRLARWLDDDALVQPMGLDLARFDAIAHARGAHPATATAPPMLLVAARLVPLKGVDVALAAFARLRTPARLVVAGDGPERAALRALAPAGATLLGEVDTRRRDELLREASVVIVPSRITARGRTEGTPSIALEALASGVPVVASAVGGLRDLPAARLVPPDDPPALARELERVLAEPPPPLVLRQSVAHLDWPTVAHRLLRKR
ncbi:MAG TPA: glycosyltransferase family 4 protein [Kofleriaceae bacterium]|nr:glycosyltransferase family 4 protein [Kofleriaceae bacterium]